MGETLKRLRLLNQKSQKEVAESIKVTAQAYFKYETGDAKPTIENLIKLANLYNVTIDYLVGRDFQGDVGYLNEKQRNLLLLIRKLNDANIEKVASFTAGVLAMQD